MDIVYVVQVHTNETNLTRVCQIFINEEDAINEVTYLNDTDVFGHVYDVQAWSLR